MTNASLNRKPELTPTTTRAEANLVASQQLRKEKIGLTSQKNAAKLHNSKQYREVLKKNSCHKGSGGGMSALLSVSFICFFSCRPLTS